LSTIVNCFAIKAQDKEAVPLKIGTHLQVKSALARNEKMQNELKSKYKELAQLEKDYKGSYGCFGDSCYITVDLKSTG